MQNFFKKVSLSVMYYIIVLLPLVAEGLSYDQELLISKSSIHKNPLHNSDKLSNEMIVDIEVHGILLWVSMGFLMPAGILTIRMSSRDRGSATQLKVLCYLHVLLQTLSVLLATAGAVMSIKKFENSFNNNHQRIGLALYVAIWVQAFVGFIRPHRGRKERSIWYLVHWILGTIISIVAIINIYTGLNAYNLKTSKRIGLWTIIFTVQVAFFGFFYLFQDKRDYMLKQGVILRDITRQQTPSYDLEGIQNQNEKKFSPEPDPETLIVSTGFVPNPIQSSPCPTLLPAESCVKQNALKNLFD